MKTLLQLAPISAQTDTDPGPDWRTQAACLDRDPELFFPHPSDETVADQVALKWCSTCPVTEQCLKAALAFERGQDSMRFGIWGGRTPEERARIDRQRGSRAAA